MFLFSGENHPNRKYDKVLYPRKVNPIWTPQKIFGWNKDTERHTPDLNIVYTANIDVPAKAVYPKFHPERTSPKHMQRLQSAHVASIRATNTTRNTVTSSAFSLPQPRWGWPKLVPGHWHCTRLRFAAPCMRYSNCTEFSAIEAQNAIGQGER